VNSTNQLTFWQLRRVRDRSGKKCKQVRSDYQLNAQRRNQSVIEKASLRARGTHVLLNMNVKISQDGKGNEQIRTYSLWSTESMTNQDSKRRTACEENSPAVKRRRRNKSERQDKSSITGNPHSEFLLGAEGGSSQNGKRNRASEGHLPAVKQRQVRIRTAREIQRANGTHKLPSLEGWIKSGHRKKDKE
jgi:hypothetical protein